MNQYVKNKRDIGIRLKLLREKKGYTITKLVDILYDDYFTNIDEKTIRRYEKGEFFPKIDNLIIFSALYNTTLDYIVFGKETSDDNSYTFKDNFKRINRLIYSCMLFPFKSPDNNKYYLTGFDEELKIYLDRLLNFISNKNYGFEVRNKNIHFDISDLDNLINDFDEYKEQLAPPTKKRIDKLLIEVGINPEEYLLSKIKTINDKRK